MGDLINFQKMLNHSVLNESGGSEEMNNIEQQLICILQSHNQQLSSHPVTKKTGHARFRCAPCTSCVQSEPVEVKLHSNFVELNKKTMEDVNSGNSCGMSWITGEEGSVCNGKTLFWTPALRTFSSGKPPLPTSHRKRSVIFKFRKASTSRGCHCCNRRKTVIKREIKRVTMSGGADDIPTDKYPWKRSRSEDEAGRTVLIYMINKGYYKCNSVQGCPARKHVERDSNDPTILILIYEGEHRHHHHSGPLE